jgi:hypothetical protein
LFYIKSKDKAIKTIQEGLILNHLTDRGLAYWIMGDGSLQKYSNNLFYIPFALSSKARVKVIVFFILKLTN